MNEDTSGNIKKHLRRYNQMLVDSFHSQSMEQLQQIEKTIESELKKFKQDLNDKKLIFDDNMSKLDEQT